MLQALPGSPSSFTLIPALQYGEVPGLPPWEAPLHLDMLCSSPLPVALAPAVIYLHGGGWAEGERSTGLYPWLNPLLAAHGFITVSVTYRLSRFTHFPAQIHDAKAAVRWVRAHAEQYHINPEHIGAWGQCHLNKKNVLKALLFEGKALLLGSLAMERGIGTLDNARVKAQTAW